MYRSPPSPADSLGERMDSAAMKEINMNVFVCGIFYQKFMFILYHLTERGDQEFAGKGISWNCFAPAVRHTSGILMSWKHCSLKACVTKRNNLVPTVRAPK